LFENMGMWVEEEWEWRVLWRRDDLSGKER